MTVKVIRQPEVRCQCGVILTFSKEDVVDVDNNPLCFRPPHIVCPECKCMVQVPISFIR